MSKLLYFLIGASAGSLLTWRYIKGKYEEEKEDEILKMREYYHRKDKENLNKIDKLKEQGDKLHDEIKMNNKEMVNTIKKDIREYAKIAKDSGYIKYDNSEKPYVIAPEESGELYDYETVTLIFYADHVLAEEDGDLVENISELVGDDFDTHFGEYESDSVYIRNDAKKCDYEILKDLQTYEEATGKTLPNWWENK